MAGNDSRLPDSATFWLGLGGVVATLAAIPLVVGTVQREGNVSLWSNGWFTFGFMMAAAGVLAVIWSLVLFLAHRHSDARNQEGIASASSPSLFSGGMNFHESTVSHVGTLVGSGPGLPEMSPRVVFGIEFYALKTRGDGLRFALDKVPQWHSEVVALLRKDGSPQMVEAFLAIGPVPSDPQEMGTFLDRCLHVMSDIVDQLRH